MRAGSLVVFLLMGATLTVFAGLPETGESAIWSSVEEISMDLGTENQTRPSIAVDGGNVHIVWQDNGDGDADIYHRLFDGSNWQPEGEISTDALDESQTGPRVAVEGDEVYVVWADEGDGDGDVYYRHFNGTSWEPEEEISTDSENEGNAIPDIAVENGKVHVVWMDEGDGDQDIYYRHFNGSSWEPELEISTDAGIENQSFPSIAMENGRIHIVWMDKGDGDWDVYYRLYDGADWQTEVEVSVGLETEHQMCPRIAAEDGEVHVVWTNSSLAGAVYIYHRHFNGSSWLPEQKVNTETESQFDFQFWPDVAVEAGKAFVVWQDAQELVEPAYVENDIHLRMLHENEWTPEVEVSIDTATEMQGFASIAVENGIAHIAWVDLGDGDSDICFRRGEYFIPPKSHAIPPLAYWHTSSPVVIGWTASDDLNLARVSLFYRYSPDNSSWSDWSLLSTNASVSGTSSSGTFSFDAPNDDGHYELYSIAKDIHNNWEMAPQSADVVLGIDSTGPEVVGIEPSDEAMGVEVNTSIRITFSESMDETTTIEAFNLTMDGSDVNGTFDWSSGSEILTFHPAMDLIEGREYQVTLATSAEDIAGNSLTSAFEASFQTSKSREEMGFLQQYWWALVLGAIMLISILLAVWRMRKPPEPELEEHEEDLIGQVGDSP